MHHRANQVPQSISLNTKKRSAQGSMVPFPFCLSSPRGQGSKLNVAGLMSSTVAQQSENRETAVLRHDYSPEDNAQKWLAANLNEDVQTERPTCVASCTSFFVKTLSTLRFPRRRSDLLPVMSVRNLSSRRQGNEEQVIPSMQCRYNEDRQL